MSFIHICPKCKAVFKYPSLEEYKCPDCRVPLISPGISDVEWNNLSPTEKNTIRNSPYNQEELEKRRKAEQQSIIEAQKRAATLPSILISSGFNFDGYRIVKYSGYISGDDAIQINRDDLFKNNGQYLTDCLTLIRAQALKELKEAAYDLGCNAVIGVDFDYMTFEPETINGTIHYYQPYVVCVTANGNAVIIEKDN